QRVMDGLLKQKGGRRQSSSVAPRTSAAIEVSSAPVTRMQVEPAPEEKALLRLMLEFGIGIVEFVLSNMSLDEFSEGPSRDAVAALVEMYQRGEIDSKSVLDGSRGDPVQRLVSEVLMDRHEPSGNWSRQKIDVPRLHNDPRGSATSAMVLLKLDRIDERIDRVKDAIRIETDDEK